MGKVWKIREEYICYEMRERDICDRKYIISNVVMYKGEGDVKRKLKR